MTSKVGDIFNTNCGDCTIIDYVSCSDVTVRFVNTGSEVKCSVSNLRKGRVLDPYYPKLYGLGFVGIGKYRATTHRKLHTLWTSMFRRCYTEGHKNKSYEGCTVVKRWHNFQNFCADIIKMPNWNTPGFDLDKDLRVLGNKKYGPKYCSFVPREINSAFSKRNAFSSSGVYKNRGKFTARITTAKGQRGLGTFEGKRAAQNAYNAAKQRHLKALVRKHQKCLDKQVLDTLTRILTPFANSQVRKSCLHE